MKSAFVTLLCSSDFLPGVLALNQSLKRNENRAELVVLIAQDIQDDVIFLLRRINCKTKRIDPIVNPVQFRYDERGFANVYSKLRVFEMCEYDKIIYLDADIIVCDNIELLFGKPHMSAVVSGGLLPENNGWDKLNSGLLVIQPSVSLFKEMLSLVNILPSADRGDQGFLQSYFTGWPSAKELHLKHGFNIPAFCLDDYCELFDFEFEYHHKILHQKNVSVLHFWGKYKPWCYGKPVNSQQKLTKYEQAINLWWDYLNSAVHDE